MPEDFPIYFSIYRKGEWVNDGPISSVGTLAARVLAVPTSPPDSVQWPLQVLRLWPALLSSSDVQRLGEAIRDWKSTPITRRVAASDLQRVRSIAESFVGGRLTAHYVEPGFGDYRTAVN